MSVQLPPPSNTCVVFGHSFVARGYSVSGTPPTTLYSPAGWYNWTLALLQQRVKLLNVAGISGDTVDGIMARAYRDVVAYKPGWVLFDGLINSVSNSTFPWANRSTSQLAQLLPKLFGMFLTAGSRVLVMGVGPHNTATAAQQAQANKVNLWLKHYCAATPGLYFCDWAPRINDFSGSTLNWIIGYSADGLHPNQAGAARIGRAAYQILDPLIPKADYLFGSSADADNYIGNPWFNGTVGTVAVPSIWSANGGLTNGTCTIAARTDQGAGQIARVTTTSAQSAMLYQDSTKFLVGQKVCAAVELTAPTAWTSITDLRLRAIAYDSGFTQLAATEALTSDGTTWPVEQQPLTEHWVLRTPDLVLPANTTRVRLGLLFNGQGSVDWMRPELRLSPQPGTP